MSRAFVDESAQQPHEEDAPELKIPLPPGARNYSTPRGAERLRAELADLEQSARPRLMAAIGQVGATDRDALAQQRRKLAEMDRRIEYLRQMCSRLEVSDPAGQRNTARLHWARHGAATVYDLPSEARFEPGLWGEGVLER